MHPSARCEKTAEERIAPLVAIHRHRRKPPKNGCINVTLGCPIGAIHRHRRKTAEERFHTLARGWLAYPVTPMHARLPPKSGCINVIPRFALSRRRATALFHNPVRKAQRSVPGFSSTPTSACRRYATSPPSSDCASPSSAIIIGLRQRRDAETAEERFNMLARGWLAYPVTPMHAHLPPKSGCINVNPRFALSRRRATALFHNPVRKAQRSVPGFSSTPTSACRRYATSPPSAVASHIIRHPSDCPIVRHPSDCTPRPPSIGLHPSSRCIIAIGEKPPKSGFIR